MLMTYYYISRKLSELLAISAIAALCSFAAQKKQVEGTIYEDAQVLITSKVSQCILPHNGTENFNAMLTIRNKTSHKISVSFSRALYYDDQCVSCGSEESRFRIEVGANGTRTAACEGQEDYALRIFHHMPNGMAKAKLTDIRLDDVKVQTIP